MAEKKNEEQDRVVEKTVYLTCDKNEYFRCSMYYMRRYFGLREIIVLALLLGIGLTLFFLLYNMFILVLFGISVLLILIALVLFLITSTKGYEVDMVKKEIFRQKLEFAEDALLVTSMDKAGTPIFIETHPYEKIECVSVKKKRIYIYAQVSVFYYLFAEHYAQGDCEDVERILKEKLKPEQFRIRRGHRIFPKRKKPTLEPEE